MVEIHAKGLIVDDGPLSRPVPVALRCDPSDAEGDGSATVRLVFPEGTTWTFPRAVLERGLRAPARHGDIGVWPCGRVQTVVELHTSGDVAMVQFDSSALLRFLRRTYAITASHVTR
ncbi:SsgA family sporulation/cell division regulator [Streptomyces sp. NPDC003036]|uniref:SsgA family sporulation/cell division regulator n=1 Tax=Streptomyces sp. NPDC003036 TaxID=3154442 RepID=UPI0033A33899